MADVMILCTAAFASGLTASLGLGGGMVLLVYLTVIAGTPQLEAQGINLIFFLPIAAVSLIIHTKAGLVRWDQITPALIWGAFAAAVFSFAANHIGSEHVQKGFAVLLIVSGAAELFGRGAGKAGRDKAQNTESTAKDKKI